MLTKFIFSELVASEALQKYAEYKPKFDAWVEEARQIRQKLDAAGRK